MDVAPTATRSPIETPRNIVARPAIHTWSPPELTLPRHSQSIPLSLSSCSHRPSASEATGCLHCVATFSSGIRSVNGNSGLPLRDWGVSRLAIPTTWWPSARRPGEQNKSGEPGGDARRCQSIPPTMKSIRFRRPAKMLTGPTTIPFVHATLSLRPAAAAAAKTTVLAVKPVRGRDPPDSLKVPPADRASKPN